EAAQHAHGALERIWRVRVVDQHGERPTVVDPLHSPGDAPALADSVGDGRQRHLLCPGNGRRGEDVLEMRVSDQAGFDAQVFVADAYVAVQAGERAIDLDRRYVRRLAVPEADDSFAGRRYQSLPVGIVAVDRGEATLLRRGGQQLGEEPLLGGEITLHVGVEVEVVARQVGEQGAVPFAV